VLWHYSHYWHFQKQPAWALRHTRHRHQRGTYLLSWHLLQRAAVRRLGCCLSAKWVMSRVWMSIVAHMDESCRTDGWVVLHTFAAARSGAPARLLSLCKMGHVPCANEPHCTYGWIRPHTCMSHVTDIIYSAQRCASSVSVFLYNESCPVREWVMSHICMNHATQTWISHVTPVSCSAQQGVLARFQSLCTTSHVLCVNVQCRTYRWDMSDI